MAIGNMHRKISKDRACGSVDMLAARLTDAQTDVLITILCHRSCKRSKLMKRTIMSIN